jgi:hypothetical protein
LADAAASPGLVALALALGEQHRVRPALVARRAQQLGEVLVGLRGIARIPCQPLQ